MSSDTSYLGSKETRDLLIKLSRGSIPKSRFKGREKSMQLAQQLMWDGFVESGGDFGDNIRLTPAGRHLLDNMKLG